MWNACGQTHSKKSVQVSQQSALSHSLIADLIDKARAISVSVWLACFCLCRIALAASLSSSSSSALFFQSFNSTALTGTDCQVRIHVYEKAVSSHEWWLAMLS